MTTCKEWAVPEGFFQGLCSKTYEPLQGTDECPVCVVPALQTALCSVCPQQPPYIINLSISGAFAAHLVPGGYTSVNPSDAYDNNTWALVNTGNCVWESDETEMCTGAGASATQVGLYSNVAGCCVRKRFKLTLTGVNANNKLSWSLEVRYNSQAGVIRQHTWFHNAVSDSCIAPITKWTKGQYNVSPGRSFPTQLFLSPYGHDDLFVNLAPFISVSV
jgi:hypothetical protein